MGGLPHLGHPREGVPLGQEPPRPPPVTLHPTLLNPSSPMWTPLTGGVLGGSEGGVHGEGHGGMGGACLAPRQGLQGGKRGF